MTSLDAPVSIYSADALVLIALAIAIGGAILYERWRKRNESRRP